MEMAVSEGNRRGVYLDLERSVELANKRAELQGRLEAEIVPDVAGSWHVLVTAPNEERSLAAHLIGRRFGVYLPMVTSTVVRRGRVYKITRPMFPGYLFVFGWGIVEQQRRILACPGAVRFLHTVSGSLLVVADHMIDKIQAAEAANDEEVKAAVQEVVDADEAARKPCKRSKRKKWRKKGRKVAGRQAPMAVEDTKMEIVISTRSDWTGIEALPEEGRISLLHAALGLGSERGASPVSPVADDPAQSVAVGRRGS